MIDVMFFLLATFMIASLTMQNLHSLRVNLPEGRAEPIQTRASITLTVTKDGAVLVNEVPVSLDTLTLALQPLIPEAEANIIVAADAGAPNGVVVQAMLRAREAGAQHFLIAVQRN